MNHLQKDQGRGFIIHHSSLIIALAVCCSLAARAADTNGPTVQLRVDTEKTSPVSAFMYFVPLISPEPVSATTSPGSTQAVRVLSAKRRVLGRSFTTVCEIEVSGQGSQQSVFDLTPAIRRNASKLQNGGSLGRQLKSIDVRGAGAIVVEVEGAVSNGVDVVNEVLLRFNPRGRTSPVWINLCDIRGSDGDFRPANELTARVNTLTFRRKPGPPRMEVTVASVKHKDAGEGFWQNLKGHLAGAAVNMLIDPLKVEAIGHQAMLDFGLALVSGAPSFTFPPAKNLRDTVR
jgi:hypothetical protein